MVSGIRRFRRQGVHIAEICCWCGCRQVKLVGSWHKRALSARPGTRAARVDSTLELASDSVSSHKATATPFDAWREVTKDGLK